MRVLFGVALCASLVLATRVASADCMSADGSSIVVSKVTRSMGGTPSAQTVFYIAREDCLDGDVFTFPYSLSAAAIGTNTFEVWIAPNEAVDCTDPTTRNGTLGITQCKELASSIAAPTTAGNILLSAKLIADSTDSVSNCEYTGSASAPVPARIYFMLVSPGEGAATATCLWRDTSVDLIGPAPPTHLTASGNDQLAMLSYIIDASPPDTVGYQYFCDPPAPQGFSDAGSGGTGGTGASTSTGDGAGGTEATEASTSGTLTGGGSSCPSSALFTGKVPDPKYACGKSGGATGKVHFLTNGKVYAIGVAAYDDLGNIGPLSNVACVTPDSVRSSRGRGCALSSSGETTRESAGFVIGLGLFGLTALRRRRRQLVRLHSMRSKR